MSAIALVQDIPGWMEPEDATKLYELASASSGPILEIGTYHGKSAVLMAHALADAGHSGHIYTLDTDKAAINAAIEHAQRHGLLDRIVFFRATLLGFMRAYPWLRPCVTFVDGDHRAFAVEADLAVLSDITPKGGILLFHDYVDPLNDDPGCDEIKVRPTVDRSWVGKECEFGGTFGGCGLFTRLSEPTRVVSSLGDLIALDTPRNQYLHRLRYPAGRSWRRLRGINPRVLPSSRR